MRNAWTVLVLVPGLLVTTLTNDGFADTELSEHTAVLIGAGKDTLGVSLRFDAKHGWAMKHRAKPGAPARLVPLPFLPADHAHYAVVVHPGRARLTFVTTGRAVLDARTPVVWVVDSTGAVKKTFVLGALLTRHEIAAIPPSFSHARWLDGVPVVAGPSAVLQTSGATLTVDAAKLTATRSARNTSKP